MPQAMLQGMGNNHAVADKQNLQKRATAGRSLLLLLRQRAPKFQETGVNEALLLTAKVVHIHFPETRACVHEACHVPEVCSAQSYRSGTCRHETLKTHTNYTKPYKHCPCCPCCVRNSAVANLLELCRLLTGILINSLTCSWYCAMYKRD